MGVQLKPFPLKTIREDEEFVDLRLLGGEASSSCSSHHLPQSGGCGGIAVRRKPKTKRNNRRRNGTNQNTVYQIDLDPVGSSQGARGGKSFLEVMARTVKKEVPEGTASALELDKVELQLRHVVDPQDGMPRQIVTEAIFQVPLSKAVQPEQEDASPGVPPQDLLQISIQNLQPESIQLVLKQVDPVTRETVDMQNLIDIQLHREEGMRVQLQKIPTTTTTDRWGNAACKDAKPCSGPCRHNRSTIELKRVQHDLGHDDEYEEDQQEPTSVLPDHHEDCNSSIHLTLKDCVLEMSSLTVLEDGDWWEAEQQQQQSQETSCKMHPSSTCKGKACCDQCPSMPTRSSHTLSTMDESSSTRGRMPFPTDELHDDDSDDDSSISSSDSSDSLYDEKDDSDSEESDDDELELVEIVPPPQETTTISRATKRRDLLALHGRMGCPTKAQMKERVKKMQGAGGNTIVPEDVELLPWLDGGLFLNYRAMSHMFLNDGEERRET